MKKRCYNFNQRLNVNKKGGGRNFFFISSANILAASHRGDAKFITKVIIKGRTEFKRRVVNEILLNVNFFESFRCLVKFYKLGKQLCHNQMDIRKQGAK